MPKRTEKQKDFVKYYADCASETYNDAKASGLRAGYSISTCNNAVTNIIDKTHLRPDIEAYKAKIARKLNHDRDIAIHMLHKAYDVAETQSNPNAMVSAVRELDAISSLHSQLIQTADITAPDISEQDKDLIDGLALEYKRKKSIKVS